MAASLIVTVIGRDRPGLVSALSEKVAAFGGSWLESRMARLAGEFAGIVLVDVPEEAAETLAAALRDLEAMGLRATVERSRGEAAAANYRTLTLELIGHDRPGIVRDVTQALAQHRVNIEEFTSGITSASFSGEKLFKATARLRVLGDVAIDELRSALERLANEIMVDLALEEDSESAR
ncbi:MAG: ACT domain-containing protein [Solirubrobacterales bacterium]|nr:ACT domain-containing protein [Solirubrobacterales bacterium]